MTEKHVENLEVELRSDFRSTSYPEKNHADMVPGLVSGGDAEPLPINIPFNKLLTMLRRGRFKSTLFNMKVEGHEDVRVICQNVQRHVVKDLPTHVDFMRLRRTTKVNLYINVQVTGEDTSPGLKKGGVLTLIRPEVELCVMAGDIPESLIIDISALEVGDYLKISDVTLPEGAKPTIDRDFAIAQISEPLGMSDEEVHSRFGRLAQIEPEEFAEQLLVCHDPEDVTAKIDLMLKSDLPHSDSSFFRKR